MASKVDTSLFVFVHNGIVMYVLVYVDDIIVASSCGQATEGLVQKLRQEFLVKDLWELHYFLGIEVKKEQAGLVLSQRKYVYELLQRSNMVNCKHVTIYMSTTENSPN